MAKKIIGNTKIELTDVRTGKTTTYEKKNMLTSHLSKILSINPFGMVRADSLMPLVGRVLGGIALFPENKTEDVNNDILYNDFTAYAQVNANGTPDTRRGSFNFSESGPLTGGKDGYKFVWDFTTSQGNGTYKCIGLTHPYIDKDRMNFAPTTNYGSSYGYSSWTLYSSTDLEAYNVLYTPQLYDEETGTFYRLYASSQGATFTIYKGRRPMDKVLIGEAPWYGTTSTIDGIPPAIVDGRSTLIYDYESRQVTLNNRIFGTYYGNSCSFRKEGGVPYAYIFSVPYSTSVSTSAIIMTKINLNKYTFEEKTLKYSGADFRASTSVYSPLPETFPFIGNYLFVPKKNASDSYATEGYYKVNINDESDITSYAFPEDVKNCYAKNVFWNPAYGGYIMKNDYGYWWVKCFYQSNNDGYYTVAICNDEMILVSARSMYQNTSYVSAPHSIKNTWIGKFGQYQSSESFIPEMSNYYLLSINNLAEPVTKTSEQLMKITYTLTEVDE